MQHDRHCRRRHVKPLGDVGHPGILAIAHIEYFAAPSLDPPEAHFERFASLFTFGLYALERRFEPLKRWFAEYESIAMARAVVLKQPMAGDAERPGDEGAASIVVGKGFSAHLSHLLYQV